MADEEQNVDTDNPEQNEDVETTNEPTAEDAAADEPSGDDAAQATTEATEAAETTVEAKAPEFASFEESLNRNRSGSMDRFYDVQVPVWAELGRIELELGQLIQLAEGSVLRLDRPTSEPVDIVSQGVRLARGEVIVIDDCFAVRIKELVASK